MHLDLDHKELENNIVYKEGDYYLCNYALSFLDP